MTRPKQQTTPLRDRSARQPITQTIGPWHLVQMLGEGTWTEVFQARPTSSTRSETADYVVKTLKPECQDDPLAIQLLQREVYVAQHVNHPHLSSILSAHTNAAPRYVVMPHIEGISAADALQQVNTFQLPQALWITRQCAEALAELHKRGWLHADVKPANIIVAMNGHATLVDLGLAQRVDDSQHNARSIAGSMAYASPETFNPHIPLGPACDVYSLGVSLYELLTGQLPFRDQDPTDLAAAHLTRQPPELRDTVPQVSRRVSRLLRKMLAKDPLRRPSLDELIDWLVDLEVESFSERLSA